MSREVCAIWQRLNCLKSSFQGLNSAATHTMPDVGPSESRDGTRVPAKPTGVICRPTASSVRWPMTSEVIEGNERTAYVALERVSSREQGIAYGTRVLWRRSHRSSPRTGKPSTWRRVAGRKMSGEVRAA
jgi:hypothetical protein